MRDVADHIGVSRQLVSLVMRNAPGPSAESRDRVLAAAEELGYRPHASARLLRQSRTHTIGVAFEITNPFQVRVVERMFAEAAHRGFTLALGPFLAGKEIDQVISELIEERVEALIAFNPDPASPALAEAFSRMPVAWLGEWTTALEADNIHVDERDGLRRAVEHLVAFGHRRIAYAGGEGGNVGRDRADAYREAMTGVGLADEIDVVSSSFFEEDGAAAARTLLERGQLPTAVVCSGDQSAVGLLAVFARAGVRVPDDVSVIGFDDSYLAGLSYHQLTSVHQDVEETVEASLDAVIDRIQGGVGPRRVVATATDLTVRASTGPARAGS
jgi:DNA-binding LacI/PurR family transcriptional regulator